MTYPGLEQCPYCGWWVYQEFLYDHIVQYHPEIIAPSPPPVPPPEPTPPEVTYYTLTVIISPSGSGSIIPTPYGDYVSPGKMKFPAGTVVSLNAIPTVVGAYFDHWEGAASGTMNPISVVMNFDKSITAVFKIVPGIVTTRLTTSVTGSGQIDPSDGIFNINDQIILVATPMPDNVFVSWGGDIDGTTPVAGKPDYLSVIMDRDRHITATFMKIPAPPPGEPGFRNLSVSIRK